MTFVRVVFHFTRSIVSGQGKGSDKEFDIGGLDYNDFKKKPANKLKTYEDEELSDDKQSRNKKKPAGKVLSSGTSGQKTK